MVAKVLVEIKAGTVDKTFTYSIPSALEDKIKVGIRVLVPFGRQMVEGFVLEISNDKELDYEIKDINDVIDNEPVINEEMLELGKFISKNTFTNLIFAYQTMLPSALKAKNGLVVNKKYVSFLELIDNTYEGKTIAARNVLKLFENNNKVLKSDASKVSVSAVKTLVEKGILKETQEETYRLSEDDCKENCDIVLNNEQSNAVNAVKNSLNKFESFLLHGVTGSGKTEVYMHIIDEVLNSGKEAIVLVPEISLTPQLVNTFKRRFGSKIAILHSRLSNGEKYDEWRKIERKEVSIAIGARSAIFAPFTNLGIIIIDEEHTTTYKQENNPRYSAIDVALWRAKRYNCPVVLGSATPSIESYTRAVSGIYTLLTMKERVNKNLPKVELVNMRDEIKKGNKLISEILYNSIQDRLNKKEQTILLLNRRGYSTVISCHDCGYTYKCPNCDIPLTYHKGINKMKCHYCDMQFDLLDVCPECKSKNINQFGIGTEKLEQEIIKMFPGIRTVRMDVDTTTLKGSHEKIINAFSEGKYDILIGTQMISKGLDFANVTLVGVVNGDASLNIPDFRNAERTFQLLNQVAGRAGRAEKKGNVIIQGFNIDHYSIVMASHHDYLGFYNEELRIRKVLKYPPFSNLAFIKISSADLSLAQNESNKMVKFLKDKLQDTVILGPSMASIPKLNNIYNMQIIIKYKKLKDIYKELDYLVNHYKTVNKITVQIDINPLRM